MASNGWSLLLLLMASFQPMASFRAANSDAGEDLAEAVRSRVPEEFDLHSPESAAAANESFEKRWSIGLGSDRSLGRPKEWNGESASFDDFMYKYQNWVGALPGGADQLLDSAVKLQMPIALSSMSEKEKVMARGIATGLRALVGGKALMIIRHLPERSNGFEMWRTLHREYRPETATRKFGMLERIMHDEPRANEEFGEWFHRWMDMVSETEKVREKPIDDDIKVAVVLRRAPKELKDHLVLESAAMQDTAAKFPKMRELVGNWFHTRKGLYGDSRTQGPAPMEIGSVIQDSHSSICPNQSISAVGSWDSFFGRREKERESTRAKERGSQESPKVKARVLSKALGREKAKARRLARAATTRRATSSSTSTATLPTHTTRASTTSSITR